jgi:excisionase family DNA binding protein
MHSRKDDSMADNNKNNSTDNNFAQTESIPSNAKLYVPIWHKLNLTIEEAAVYSHIGKDTLRDYIKSKNYNLDFVLMVGSKVLIKRELFEKHINKLSII